MRITTPLSLLALVLLSGCAVVTRPLAEWKPVEGFTGPLTGVGQQAVTESRSYFKTHMSDAQGHDERWRSPDGRTADPWKVSTRLVDWLTETGDYARWPKTQSHVYKTGAQRLAPYKIYIVSLFPTVAIFAAHDYGPIRNRSNNDLVGSDWRTFSDTRLLNRFHFGTAVPEPGPLFWTSPELKVGLTPIRLNPDGGFTINHPKFVLVGQNTPSAFVIERTK